MQNTQERIDALEGQVNDLIKVVNTLSGEMREFRQEMNTRFSTIEEQNKAILKSISVL
ncbi:MAG: hypothetical protein OXC82_01400 [Rhodobacteraceae bacterium]|nr:hypothetical protein [Paracoccaceae bacterium]MCY4249083.1 hypothetical protein [Paracoccaceae bacterium]